MTDISWLPRTRNLNELKENPYNPRRLTKNQAAHLKKSLDKFGVCEPIVINTDGMIIGGHQRCRTLRKLGYTQVPVYEPDRELDKPEVEELTIRLNKNVGEWDDEILANLWAVEDLVAWGFTEDELQVDIETIEGTQKEDSKKSKINTCPNCGHEF